MPRGITNGRHIGAAGNPTPVTPTESKTLATLTSTSKISSNSTDSTNSTNNTNSTNSNSFNYDRITSSVKYRCRRRIFGGTIFEVVPPAGGTYSTLTVIVQCLVIILALRINVVLADCWYDNGSHPEGVEVSTAEPCLNCTCTRGALLCYLRICPQLPNPPPSGCILLHRHRTCCPELICTDPPMGNRIEARSDSDYSSMDFPRRRIPALKHACISNGTIYAPGSAMDTSSQCEYCYCLGGEQQCVKPKCLAPLDGCVPRYDPNDCCPIHYNCTQGLYTTSSSTTTTVLPIEYDSRGGCIVESKFYPEGHKVLGFGHSICDNCYCIRGMIRCEPLSCAPALFGCLPVIKTGECCPASYNCSGTIETHPLPHYGQFPVVSKEYAKLRKETQYKRTTSKFVPHYKRHSSTENTNRPYYVIAESQKSTKSHKDFSYTESSRIINIETYTKDPYYVTVNNRENETKTKSTNGGLGIVEITYRPKYNNSKHIYQFSASDHDRNKTVGTTESTLSELRNIDPILSVDLFLDERINRGIEGENTTTTQESSTNFENQTVTDITTTLDEFTDSTTITQLTTTEDDVSSTETSTSDTTLISTEASTETDSTTLDINLAITLKTILNSTECVEENNSTDVVTVSTENPINLLEADNATDIRNKVEKVELRNVALINDTQSDDNIDSMHMVLLNNLTKAKEDYDYDYAEPTLPPSLPNLRIIPFVAADALESKKDVKKSDIYVKNIPNNHQAEEFPFAGIFSPPAETEGGFIPKEPVIINHHAYYTTTNDANGEGPITTNPVPAITNAPITKQNSCIVDGRTVTHEESITTEGSCKTCVCYFGSVVCQEPDCPLPKPGCKMEKDKSDDTKCCPKIICDNDVIESSEQVKISTISPSLDIGTVADSKIVTLRPMINVITTEIAPTLNLHINDLGPYFSQKFTEIITTTTPGTSTSNNMKDLTTSTVPNKINKSTQKPEDLRNKIVPSIPLKVTTTSTTEASDDGFSLDKVWKLLFSSDLDESTTQNRIAVESTIATTTTTPKSTTRRVAIMESDLLLPLEQLNFQTRDNIYDNMVRRQDFIIPPTDTTKSINNNINNNIGLLKLAGCNIYGRMYRVGRIISELSGPCLECKCTESGVQCHPLLC